MPQPLSRVAPKAQIALDINALRNKPEMAILVTEIFASWAQIELGLSALLVRVLGAVEGPAIAMYSVLTAQHLQNKALEAAAKSALQTEHYQVFLAVMSAIEIAQSARNRLAHWTWGSCKERPDLLILADPKMVKERNLNMTREMIAGRGAWEFVNDDWFLFDPSHALCYSKADLESAKADLEEAADALRTLEFYLQPQFVSKVVPQLMGASEEKIRDLVLTRLNESRLFREALARIRAGQQNTPPKPDESPAPGPKGS